MIKVIKKEDVLKRLDDPKRDYIERHLRETSRHVNSLKLFIEERPSRQEFILSKFNEYALELKTTAVAE
jgi:hypothetical protein